MILSGLLWLLTWPLTIAIAYYFIKLALKKFESKLENID